MRDLYFGYSVAISGDTAIVGSYYDDDKGLDSGSAYVFTLVDGAWTQQAKLVASDGQAGDFFGYRVALSGDTALISAYGDDDGGMLAGAAYVFTRSGSIWTQQAKIRPSGGAEYDYFGFSVAVSEIRRLLAQPAMTTTVRCLVRRCVYPVGQHLDPTGQDQGR